MRPYLSPTLPFIEMRSEWRKRICNSLISTIVSDIFSSDVREGWLAQMRAATARWAVRGRLGEASLPRTLGASALANPSSLLDYEVQQRVYL